MSEFFGGAGLGLALADVAETVFVNFFEALSYRGGVDRRGLGFRFRFGVWCRFWLWDLLVGVW